MFDYIHVQFFFFFFGENNSLVALCISYSIPSGGAYLLFLLPVKRGFGCCEPEPTFIKFLSTFHILALEALDDCYLDPFFK